MVILQLTPEHARQAARLHMAGQPGAFLTNLGEEVLTVFYRTLPISAVGFGFAASTVLHKAEAKPDYVAPISGFVSATTSTGQLFFEFGTRRLAEFLPPLLRRFAQRPWLALTSTQTVLYPLLEQRQPGHTSHASAELLSIMVEPAQRSQGIGAQLLAALVAECMARRITRLTVTVDENNRRARCFYERHHFQMDHIFRLYGRPMCSYSRQLLQESHHDHT
jgi:ribosomal protein S18 acetylase RimI-like enzyme